MQQFEHIQRKFAEETRVTAALTTDSLVQALAQIRRESFLPPGPRTVQAEMYAGLTAHAR